MRTKMHQSRYNEEVLVNDALRNGIIKTKDDIKSFVFAHYVGMEALMQYYAVTPRNMMSVVYKPPREVGKMIQDKLRNYQFDGVSVDHIVKGQTNILRDQFHLQSCISNMDRQSRVLTNDGLYTLPSHSHEKISEEDSNYMKAKDFIHEKLNEKRNLLRTRSDIESFVELYKDTGLKCIDFSDPYSVDRLITYLKLKNVI